MESSWDTKVSFTICEGGWKREIERERERERERRWKKKGSGT